MIMQDGENAKSWFSDVREIKICTSTLSRYDRDTRTVLLNN